MSNTYTDIAEARFNLIEVIINRNKHYSKINLVMH